MYVGCTCIYLPIKGTHVDRVQECYEKLGLDISRFQSKGRIIILGGYNERVSKDYHNSLSSGVLYCDMKGVNCDGRGGWTRVAYI